MEALSVTANIIAVLQVATTIISICCDYSAAVKGASWELPKVTEEVRSLRDVLELLAALAKREENADSSVETRLPALKRLCEPDAGPLTMCKAELESLKTKLESPKWTGPATSKRTAMMTTLSWPLKKGETKNMLQNMERYKTTLNMALEIDQTTMTLDIHNMARVIQVQTSELSEDFSTLKQAFSMAKLDDRLGSWLSAPDPSSNHNEACAKRQATTGDWLIQSSNFAKWKEDRNSLLWLHGIPGCGKTILCSTVIEHVLFESRAAVNKAVAYFYFDFRNTECQLEGMIRSLISQLAVRCTNPTNPLKSLYSSCGNGARQPKVFELKQTLQDLAQSFDDTFVILDALDEFKQREDLLDDIQEIIEWQLGSLHILVTSRRERDIKQTLDPFMNEDRNIDIQSEVVDRDIRVYVREILQTAKGVSRWRNKPEVQDEIEKALTENANGMFRWVVCQIDELKKCLNLPMLRKQLRSLPTTLPQTYERILLNIEDNYRHYALKILQWLTYSRETLSLLQLAEIVAIDEDEDPRFDPGRRFPEPEDILLICSSLVTATKVERRVHFDSFSSRSAKIVKLAHFSVKEYLVSSQIMNGGAEKYSIQEIDANICIARDCLSYLLYFSEDIPKPAWNKEDEFWADFSLAQYAAHQWQEHAGVGGQINEESMMELIMKLFTSEGNAFSSWCLDRHHNNETPLYYASRLGLFGVARSVIDTGADVHAVSGYYGNALCVASSCGCTEMVKLLLEMGSDPNFCGRRGSAVYRASYYGNDTIVRMLLDAGAEVRLETLQEFFSALHAAASRGFISIVTMLISAGVDVNISAGEPLHFINTALSAASWQGHDKVVKVLIEAGANPDSRIAALHYASRSGRDDVVKILLGAVADLNQGFNMASPLREAVRWCHPTTVKLLLEAGADVNLGGSWGRDTFTYSISLTERQQVLGLLVAAGAEITGADVTESEGESESEGETETGDETEPSDGLP